MAESKRVFIFGAGFSKPAGMPLASELLPLLSAALQVAEMREWLDSLQKRLAWLSGRDCGRTSLKLSIEEVFHYAYFDAEAHRLRQHLAPVGRGDGPGTPWRQAESIQRWLSYLEEALRDVIHEQEQAADLAPIDRWAASVREDDAVLTFNYDRLVERALFAARRPWNHGIGPDGDWGVPIFKLHGAIDWIVAHRSESVSHSDLLFEKKNVNRADGKTGSIEDDYRLWRWRSADKLGKWIAGRELQVRDGAAPWTVGIAGLGAHKELHRIPGLGAVWVGGMRALHDANRAIVVGFSMSDFDAMAQMQFAEVAEARWRAGRPLPVLVIDPCLNEATKDRFRRVFRCAGFVEKEHEQFDWSTV